MSEMLPSDNCVVVGRRFSNSNRSAKHGRVRVCPEQVAGTSPFNFWHMKRQMCCVHRFEFVGGLYEM